MKHGFSLVELSIVLVILGLLTGGILGGRELIRAAELRAVTQEAERFTTSVYTFRTKYLGMPGDLKNATQFWGAEPASNCPGDESTPSTTEATCNGNGDGQISWHGANGFGGESHRFWQHLANAGLVAGQYTGTHSAGSCNGNGSCNVTLGENAPASKYGNAGWVVFQRGQITGTAHGQAFPGNYGNHLQFGNVSNYTSSPAMPPEDAWNVDTKIDDGKPGTGWIRSWNNTFSPNCADSNDPAVAVYQLDIDSVSCQLMFIGGF